MASTKKAKKKPNLVTRAELSRLKGVSRAAVTRACRDGGPLDGAVRNNRIDLSDPLVTAWITETPRGEAGAASDASEDQPGTPTRAEMLAAQLRRRKADAGLLEARLEMVRKSVISKELVSAHVFGFIDGLLKRLLGDVPATLARKVHAAVRAGAAVEELRQIIHDEISATIKSVKTIVRSKLRACEVPTGNPPPVTDHAARYRGREVQELITVCCETIRARLVEKNAPIVVDRILRTVARTDESGDFNRALARLENIRADAEHQVQVMLTGAVDSARSTMVAPAPEKKEGDR